MSHSVPIRDLFDTTKPWVLADESGPIYEFFSFVPRHYRIGPWHWSVIMKLFVISCGLGSGWLWMRQNTPVEGWFPVPVNERGEISTLEKYSTEWYMALTVFIWMIGICHNIVTKSPLSWYAWISFTCWSWTVVVLRYALCLLAPWFPSLQYYAEVLRLPVLLSASIVTLMWNMILFPVIVFGLVKDPEKRRKMIGYFTNFRLTQLHVFNLFFAVFNGAYVSPVRRHLGMGDLAAVLALQWIYTLFYLGILDRLGIHLYPIFSPRTPLSILSQLLVLGMCGWGYFFWKGFLEHGDK